jgi:hypothetical protein
MAIVAEFYHVLPISSRGSAAHWLAVRNALFYEGERVNAKRSEGVAQLRLP